MNADGEILLTAKGVNGQLFLLTDRIRISRKGMMSLLSHGLKGDKEILLRQISSVQFKKAGLMNGYIQFAFLGGLEAKGGVLQATQDENTIMFTAKQQPAFEEMKAALDQRILAPQIPSATSNLDELEKLANLRDKGIITEEEFAAKKKLLLGL